MAKQAICIRDHRYRSAWVTLQNSRLSLLLHALLSPQVMNLQRLEGKKGLGKVLILESVLVAEVLSYIFLTWQ